MGPGGGDARYWRRTLARGGVLRPLPYTSADRLVKIEEGSSKREMKAIFGAHFLRLRKKCAPKIAFISRFEEPSSIFTSLSADVYGSGRSTPPRASVLRQ